MKDCCKTDDKPSTARKIYNGIVLVLAVLLLLGFLISVMNQ